MRNLKIIDLTGYKKFNQGWAEKEKKAGELRQLWKVVDDVVIPPHWKPAYVRSFWKEIWGKIKSVLNMR